MSKVGITTEDLEQIQEYLDKPPHQRDEDDLVPESADGDIIETDGEAVDLENS